MNNYKNTDFKALKEEIFGSPEFKDNDYFSGCSRKTVMQSDNVYFNIHITNAVYDAQLSIIEAIKYYSIDADKERLTSTIETLGVQVVIEELSFPNDISYDLLKGQDPQVLQTISLYATSNGHHEDCEMVNELTSWNTIFNNGIEPNAFFCIPKFTVSEVR